MKIDNKYQNILNEAQPYLLGKPKAFENYNLSVFGKQFEETNLKSCLRVENSAFFNLVHRMDSLTFGHQGMGMDKWVFFDCSAMPAGIFGFGIPKEKAPEDFLNMLAVEEDYEGLIPISMYMAIPTTDRNRWFGHNLSSLNSFLGMKYPGLGLLTKAFACRVFGIHMCYGATQWGSSALEIHTQLSNMKLEAAHLPAHTHQNSLCYLSDYSEENILKALSGEKRIATKHDLLLNAKDLDRQKKLQQDIERGLKVEIAGRPIHEDHDIFYPINFVED
ncbi:MAG: hypothetical protein KC478_04465 [Bacteriovoracaceae bacterium]|nr:hypothetical protein [Bacteriovoracaceae bacterium]